MNEWHVDLVLADRYAAGALAASVAASVEAHVARCGQCQSTIAPRAPRSRLDSIWAEVADRVDAPRERPIERLLVKLGMSQGDARLVACAPALRMAWVLSVCAALAFTVSASSLRPQAAEVFLLIAPILPVVGVGLAYGPWTDPMYETTVSAPYSSVRLLLLRTGMVLLVTVSLTAAAGAMVPGSGFAFIWLLPSAALVGVTLALAAWIPPLAAALLTSSGWLALGYALWLQDATLAPAFGPPGQVAALALLALAVAIASLALRTQAYETWRT
jgi:hypothetical protein